MKNVVITTIVLAMLLTAVGAVAEGGEPGFDQLAGLEWSFSSGVGAWSTDMRISADGSFRGEFHDSEMGDAGEDYPDGTVYYAAFEGQMSLVEKADELTWRVSVDSLKLEQDAGEETIADGVRYVTAEVYGLSAGDEMTLYLPGTPVEALSEDMRMWAHLFDREEQPETLENWLLYSEKNESGFVGYGAPDGTEAGADEDGMAGLANPWTDMTEEELKAASGLSFAVPEDAENVEYRWLASGNLAEMRFTLDSDEFCARVQPADEFMNISGIYFYWDNEETVTVGHCEGTIGMAQAGSEDWVELCQWYDAAPGLMYSLSVYTTDPDGLDLTAVAEMVYVPAQGEN